LLLSVAVTEAAVVLIPVIGECRNDDDVDDDSDCEGDAPVPLLPPCRNTVEDRPPLSNDDLDEWSTAPLSPLPKLFGVVDIDDSDDDDDDNDDDAEFGTNNIKA
jgi:hypothetical protein